jgi:hypothetical protein
VAHYDGLLTPRCPAITPLDRRTALQAGLAGVASFSLPDLLRARSANGTAGRRDAAVIFLLQEGGASQFETYDPKPGAPEEIRGDFKPIPTSVPGIQFSELMVGQAKRMDRFTLFRGIHHPSTQHSSSVHLIKTGYYCRADSETNEMPSVGSQAVRLRGADVPGLPPYVVIHHALRYDSGHYLGRAHDPYLVKNNLENTRFETPNLTLLEGMSAERLADRRQVLAGIDRSRREWDRRDPAGIDPVQAAAFDMVTGSAARRAFNLEAEPLSVRERYGMNSLGQRVLMARRLVETGVTFVTVATLPWDHHGSLWKDMRRDAPAYDRAVSALVDDLIARGLDRRVLVVALGEFGREPKITSINGLPPGRDHWGNAMSVLLFGGDLPRGAVIGSTDSRGAMPASGAYRLECVLALLYRHLGIDPEHAVADHTGRPRPLLEIHEPIRELA